MSIEHVRLNCRDPAALVRFYVAAFDARPTREGVALGDERIGFAKAERPDGAEFAGDETGFQHFALVVADIDAAYARLRTLEGWRPISLAGPERLPQASGGGAAFKFRDPCGHPLELLQFAPDAAPPLWRGRFAAAPERLFGGIDHTALTVADAKRSRAFYAERGFVVTRRQINQGAEQRRLDGFRETAEPTVEISSLSPPDGARPGIELLAYLTPPTHPRAASDGSEAATEMVLTGDAVGPSTDPDGHRIAFATSKPERC